MFVIVTKELIDSTEPHLGSITEYTLDYDPSELIDLQLTLMEAEGQTEEETLEHDFEVDGYVFRLGDFI